MKSKLVAAAIALLFVSTLSVAQKLDKFGAEMGKKSVMGKEVRVPYTDVISYYGYIKPGAKPDEEREGKAQVVNVINVANVRNETSFPLIPFLHYLH